MNIGDIWPPTRAQVDSISRHAITAIGVAVTLLGLQAKGISLDDIKTMIGAMGTVTNDFVVLLAAAAPVYAAIKAAWTASKKQQSIAVENAGAIVITTPAIAAETPNNPNIKSSSEVKVVPK